MVLLGHSLDCAATDFAHSRSAAHSGVMSLTGLMGLQGGGDDPWGSVRKR